MTPSSRAQERVGGAKLTKAQRKVLEMAAGGRPIVVSAKLDRRPTTWRDGRRVRHTNYPSLSYEGNQFVASIDGVRVSIPTLRALLREWTLEPFRRGWLVRARYRLSAAGRAALKARSES